MREKTQCQDPKESAHLLFVSVSVVSRWVYVFSGIHPGPLFPSLHTVSLGNFIIIWCGFGHHAYGCDSHMFISIQPWTEPLTLHHPSWIPPRAGPTGLCKPIGPQMGSDPSVLQICSPVLMMWVCPNPQLWVLPHQVLLDLSLPLHVAMLVQGPPPPARSCLKPYWFCFPSPIPLLFPREPHCPWFKMLQWCPLSTSQSGMQAFPDLALPTCPDLSPSYFPFKLWASVMLSYPTFSEYTICHAFLLLFSFPKIPSSCCPLGRVERPQCYPLCEAVPNSLSLKHRLPSPPDTRKWILQTICVSLKAASWGQASVLNCLHSLSPTHL